MEELLCRELDKKRGATAFCLLQEAMASGKIVDFEVISNSMSPFLRIGDIATIRNIGLKDLHKGDIIAYRVDNDLRVHRYIFNLKKDNNVLQLITKGDNAYHFDQPPITTKELMGKVIAIRKKKRTINMEKTSWKAINYLLANISATQAYIPVYLGVMRKVILRNSKFQPGISIKKWLCYIFFAPIRIIVLITKILPFF